MKSRSTFRIALTALFAALICVATMLVQIPIPATGGYANLGDGVILLCAFLMHPIYAVAAAGLGSLLADILTGYISYALGTLIIKAGVAWIAALLYRKLFASGRAGKMLIAMVFSGIIAETFMILGYFAYEALFLGLGMGAAGAMIGNIGQGIVGVLVACAVAPVLIRSHEMTEMMNKF